MSDQGVIFNFEGTGEQIEVFEPVNDKIGKVLEINMTIVYSIFRVNKKLN